MARSSRRTLYLAVFVLVTCGFLGIVFGQKINPAAAPGGDSDVRDSLRQFTDVYSLVEQNYAEPVNADKAIYNGAIPGMLHVLDPHSNFFDPKSYALLREDQRGKYYGVGMTVGPRNNKVIVIAPFAGTPAYRAGIRPGDIIVAVDGKPTDNMSTSDVADLLSLYGVTDPAEREELLEIVRHEGFEPALLQVSVSNLPVTAAGLARMLANLLFGVQPGDLAVFVTTTLTIAFVALLSSWMPARRASSVDPVESLRAE